MKAQVTGSELFSREIYQCMKDWNGERMEKPVSLFHLCNQRGKPELMVALRARVCKLFYRRPNMNIVGVVCQVYTVVRKQP